MTLPIVILAGGLATRMRPLTQTTPKSMLEVAGKPFIDHQLTLLKSKGVECVALCLGYLGEQIEQYVKSHFQEMSITFFYDGETPLGTGGAVKKAIAAVGDEFFVLYGDSYLNVNYSDVQAAYRASGKLGLMTVYQNSNRFDASNVLFENGELIRYSKTNRTADMHHIDYGLGILSADAFVGFDGKFDLAEVYAQLAANRQLAGYEVFERFYEIGSREGLRELEEKLQHEN